MIAVEDYGRQILWRRVCGSSRLRDPMDLSIQPLAGVTILYVEDDPDAREVMAMVLERFGATVRQAATADEALASFLDSPPSVVLADIALPRKDGLWLLDEVRARVTTPVPFIAFTALTLQRDRAEILGAGFVEYLLKPTEPDVLVQTIRKAVARPPGHIDIN